MNLQVFWIFTWCGHGTVSNSEW